MNTLDDHDFRVPGHVLTLGNVCTTFCVRSGVKFAFNRRYILNEREITLNFRQIRRMVTILEFLGLFGRWNT